MRRAPCIGFFIIASFAIAVAWASQAQAQKRVAFVVGTDKYDNLGREQQLERAVNDARAVGAALMALGFDVIAAENLTRGAFNAQFQSFLDKLRPGDTAAFYYAGHGVEIEGLNFLLPRDVPNVKFGRQEQIKRESLSVAELLLDLRSRNPEITLVILDACRDNPLVPAEMRSAGTRGGLAPLKGEPPKGTFVVYSAGAGESALDRLPGSDPDRLNSVFTRKLVPLLGTKGLALHDMARRLRSDVVELAATVPHEQRPAYYDGVLGRYCLAGCEGADDGPKRAERPVSPPRPSDAAEAWNAAKDATNIYVLEAFATRYKDTFYADMARARIEEIKKQQAAAEAARRKVEEDARAAADAERKRLAMLEEERKRAATAPRPSTGTWAELGCKQVNLSGQDRDTIRVGRREVRAIRVHLRGADVELLALRVIYAIGAPDEIPVRSLVRQGGSTRPMDLRGGARAIDRIEMVYRSNPEAKGLATVCIEGLS